MIHDMSTLKHLEPIEFELASEAPAADVANVTVREAAIRLGVSERRVRKLTRDGRVRGAAKTGAEWLIPTPVELIPGKARSRWVWQDGRTPEGVSIGCPRKSDQPDSPDTVWQLGRAMARRPKTKWRIEHEKK